jgi:hypothetical protein
VKVSALWLLRQRPTSLAKQPVNEFSYEEFVTHLGGATVAKIKRLAVGFTDIANRSFANRDYSGIGLIEFSR